VNVCAPTTTAVDKRERRIQKAIEGMDAFDLKSTRDALDKLRAIDQEAYCYGLNYAGTLRKLAGDYKGTIDVYTEYSTSCGKPGRALWLIARVAIRRPEFCGLATSTSKALDQSENTGVDAYFAACGRFLAFNGCLGEVRESEISIAASVRGQAAFGVDAGRMERYTRDLIRYAVYSWLDDSEQAKNYLLDAVVAAARIENATTALVRAIEAENVLQESVRRLDAMGLVEELYGSSLLEDLERREAAFVRELVRVFRDQNPVGTPVRDQFEPLATEIVTVLDDSQ
jgi:hypothetical protein